MQPEFLAAFSNDWMVSLFCSIYQLMYYNTIMEGSISVCFAVILERKGHLTFLCVFLHIKLHMRLFSVFFSDTSLYFLFLDSSAHLETVFSVDTEKQDMGPSQMF